MSNCGSIKKTVGRETIARQLAGASRRLRGCGLCARAARFAETCGRLAGLLA